jgi:hypothetical protein
MRGCCVLREPGFLFLGMIPGPQLSPAGAAWISLKHKA